VSGILKVSIKDMQGNVVNTFTQEDFNGSMKKEFDLSNQAAGVYYITASIANKIFNAEVVITK
jgi:hypothetical protein